MFVFSVHRHSGQVIEEGAKKPKNKTKQQPTKVVAL